MYKIAKLDTEDRRALFHNTAAKLHLNDAIVEKDFWVCLMLDYLFHRCLYKDAFTFKGGTSLSKAWHIIERFSEDVDLILDWRVLGYTVEEPWEERSNKQQDLFNKEANVQAERFIRDKLVPILKEDLPGMLGIEADISINIHEPQTIDFNYPHIFDSPAILQAIRLEIGPLASWTPAQNVEIIPYSAEQYPFVFVQKSTHILTVLPERTFWEKATILHHEAHRPETSVMPARYSRHYYDLYCLAHSYVKGRAFSNLTLLRKVVDFKKKFYPRGWAKYDEAKPGTICLMPPAHNLKVLESDYKKMSEMIYGPRPDFDSLMHYVKQLEDEINAL
ncbi:MAG: nucleotidyl transferase AbiEii/AbiGii toxin family protein [Sphaerochaetaceae bacterium]